MALRRHIALSACVTHRGEQVCQVSSLWGHVLREIIAIIGSYNGVTGANTGQLAYLRRHFHTGGSYGTETPYCTFGMRDPSGRNKSAKFRRSGSPYSER
ncbi:hypothetical protein DPMN_156089 [Dreissena polymorpha]|uniref:Uncharacterized protein n=1 Tax=Dreissena polymorpha TaxID=45954 RepID=A0A9D4JBI5_DREPO|nr:hypothetical protein DPMN_156089 [Dreissena polymorpha]